MECGGGYRDESGNSYWRIHAAMKFLESKKINRDEFDALCTGRRGGAPLERGGSTV